MTYEEKRLSPLYSEKNIEYIFIERLKPSTIFDEKTHRVLSILGRGWYLYNEDRDAFLIMFGTHYSDMLVDSWIIEYGVSIGLSPNLFKSLKKKFWYKHLHSKNNYRHKLKNLTTRQYSLKKSSTKFRDLELLIEHTIHSMSKEQISLINKDTIYSYRQKASFYLYPEILSNIKGYNNLCRYGWYSKNNKEGMTLDHRVSIKYGFDNDIPPHILAHPANCEFLSLKDNSSKNKRCSISYTQLLFEIEQWDSQLIAVC